MTLAENLLPRLSEWHPAGRGRHSWSETFAKEGWTVHVSADKVDSLSSLVWELTLVRTGDGPTDATLQGWADGIVNRATGLMEALSVYEVDTASNEAVLRSQKPGKKGEYLAYYEVRLHGLTKAIVRRYTARQSIPGRDQVAFAITHETLAKLAGDIAG